MMILLEAGADVEVTDAVSYRPYVRITRVPGTRLLL